VPLVPLKAAAGAFSDPQHINDDGFEWAAVETRHRLRGGMFVAQVVGRSMEPAVPNGAFVDVRLPTQQVSLRHCSGLLVRRVHRRSLRGARSTIVGVPPSAVPNFAKSLTVVARRGFSDAA